MTLGFSSDERALLLRLLLDARQDGTTPMLDGMVSTLRQYDKLARERDSLCQRVDQEGATLSVQYAIEAFAAQLPAHLAHEGVYLQVVGSLAEGKSS